MIKVVEKEGRFYHSGCVDAKEEDLKTVNFASLKDEDCAECGAPLDEDVDDSDDLVDDDDDDDNDDDEEVA